jgi:hypothetical protein
VANPQTRPRQVIQVGAQLVQLPDGVTALDWALERVNFQNPRIRAFLGCIRLLDGVLESNYALLHCSPERLLDIWQRVRQVARLIRGRIAPLLEVPSPIPTLEEARQNAEMALKLLEHEVLRQLDRFPDEVAPEQLLDIRKLLCVAIGQIQAFLQDTFGELMAKDPRSLHDADYFLSKKFPKDIEEAEWLHATLLRLRDFLDRLDAIRPAQLTAPAERMRREEAVIPRGAWEETSVFLQAVLLELVPKLKEVLALRGVRFYELEILDRCTLDIPARCHALNATYDAAAEAVTRMKEMAGPTRSREEREQNVNDLLACHAVFARRLSRLMSDLDDSLRDLVAFIPIWLEGVEKRRALLLRRGGEEPRVETPSVFAS